MSRQSPYLRRTWGQALGIESKVYRDRLNEVVKYYGPKLDSDLIKYIRAVESSSFLRVAVNQTTPLDILWHEFGVSFPPILGGGGDRIIVEDIKNIGLLQKEITKLANDLNVTEPKEWLQFRFAEKQLGIDRFDEADYEKWKQEHPGPKSVPIKYVPCS